MRIRWSYRHDPAFVLRRLNRIAGHVNVFLLVFAVALAALDMLYAGKKIAAELTPASLTATVNVSSGM